MAHQIVCDTCGEVIDQSASYFSAHVSSVQMIDGALVSGGTATQLDYHSDHLPTDVATHIPPSDG